MCTNGSPNVCSLIPNVCGDGIRSSTEICDNGSLGLLTGCSLVCTVVSGFECGGGSITSPDICTAICGDGKRVGLEECDDGNQLGGDGCD